MRYIVTIERILAESTKESYDKKETIFEQRVDDLDVTQVVAVCNNLLTP